MAKDSGLTRRDFMKAAGAASIGLALGAGDIAAVAGLHARWLLRDPVPLAALA